MTRTDDATAQGAIRPLASTTRPQSEACVIGWPIKHSRSPLIHGYWLETYGLPGRYTKRAIEPDQVANFFATLAEQGLAGCNVTLPHKQAALAAAVHKDPSALAVGVANTLWFEGGVLAAANTDTYGFMMHLANASPNWTRHDRPALVIGAGGAARAIVYGLLQAGVGRVLVANRTRERAQTLTTLDPQRVIVVEWAARNDAVAQAGTIVNTTSLGMVGQPPLDLDLSRAPGESTVADIVYAPLETPLLASARQRGLIAVDGLGMLLHQAVPGFERWFGVRPEVTAELRAQIVADLEAHA